MGIQKFSKGGKSTRSRQPMVSGGGVDKPPIGKKSGGNERGSTSGAGGPSWSHLPGANSYPNAGAKGKVHTPKSPPATKSGPHWPHMPSKPGVS